LKTPQCDKSKFTKSSVRGTLSTDGRLDLKAMIFVPRREGGEMKKRLNGVRFPCFRSLVIRDYRGSGGGAWILGIRAKKKGPSRRESLFVGFPGVSGERRRGGEETEGRHRTTRTKTANCWVRKGYQLWKIWERPETVVRTAISGHKAGKTEVKLDHQGRNP